MTLSIVEIEYYGSTHSFITIHQQRLSEPRFHRMDGDEAINGTNELGLMITFCWDAETTHKEFDKDNFEWCRDIEGGFGEEFGIRVGVIIVIIITRLVGLFQGPLGEIGFQQSHRLHWEIQETIARNLNTIPRGFRTRGTSTSSSRKERCTN